MAERAAAVALLLALAARPAAAYVRTTTKDGNPFYWATRCVPVTIYVRDFTDLSVTEVAKSVAAAAHTWSPERVTCPSTAGAGTTTHPYLEIVPSLAAIGASARTPVNDARNSIVFKTMRWEPDGDPDHPHDPSALALTTVSARGNGRIVDADMEVNATHSFGDFANLDPDWDAAVHTSVFDLQATLTHEFGHLIGLEHSCYDPDPDKPRPVDDQGVPVVFCGEATAEDHAKVMDPHVSPRDSAKRVLTGDELRAACEIYAAANDPRSCALDVPDDGCSCTAGGASGGAVGAALLALVALVRAPGRGRRARRAATARRGRC